MTNDESAVCDKFELERANVLFITTAKVEALIVRPMPTLEAVMLDSSMRL